MDTNTKKTFVQIVHELATTRGMNIEAPEDMTRFCKEVRRIGLYAQVQKSRLSDIATSNDSLMNPRNGIVIPQREQTILRIITDTATTTIGTLNTMFSGEIAAFNAWEEENRF